jgi:hypothetical protein
MTFWRASSTTADANPTPHAALSPNKDPSTMFAATAARSLRIASLRHLSTTARPFQILGLQQIAVGALEKEPLTKFWEGILGLEKVGSFSSEKENVDEDIMCLGKKGSPTAVEVDLMTPLNPEGSPKVRIILGCVNELVITCGSGSNNAVLLISNRFIRPLSIISGFGSMI